MSALGREMAAQHGEEEQREREALPLPPRVAPAVTGNISVEGAGPCPGGSPFLEKTMKQLAAGAPCSPLSRAASTFAKQGAGGPAHAHCCGLVTSKGKAWVMVSADSPQPLALLVSTFHFVLSGLSYER